MYAPPPHAAPATPLRNDVVTEGACAFLEGSNGWMDRRIGLACFALPVHFMYPFDHHHSVNTGGLEQQRQLLALSGETARQQFVVPTVVDKGQA